MNYYIAIKYLMLVNTIECSLCFRHHLPEYDANLTLLLCNMAVVRQKVAISSHNWEEMKLAVADLSRVSIVDFG